MENKKIKIELILQERGYSLVVKGNQKLSSIELMGIGSLLNKEITYVFEIDENIKLSDEIEEASLKASSIPEQENNEEGFQEFIKNVISGKGTTGLDFIKNRKCNCVSCRVMKGELKLTELNEDEEKELSEIALRDNTTVEEIKKLLINNYQTLHISEENKSTEISNMVLTKGGGNA